jgi:predicted metalloprotease
MRLDGERESDNVDDRRGSGGGFPGMGGLPIGGMRIGGIGAIVLVVGALLLGVDPSVVLGILSGADQGEQRQQATSSSAPRPSGEDPQRRFVGRVLASTEDVWGSQFQAIGRRYQAPRLVLYSGVTNSACGTAQAAVGPFYCPNDRQVYLDLDFFHELQDRLGAKGDFAEAYVIAHEIGHHVQNQLGLMNKVDAARRGLDQGGRNQLSVRLELQADCYAGVWAKHADQERHILESGDIEEGLNAAAAVGDDRLQRAARGTVAPETFTHGSSRQRAGWFRRGYDSGALSQCDTFSQQ